MAASSHPLFDKHRHVFPSHSEDCFGKRFGADEHLTPAGDQTLAGCVRSEGQVFVKNLTTQDTPIKTILPSRILCEKNYLNFEVRKTDHFQNAFSQNYHLKKSSP